MQYFSQSPRHEDTRWGEQIPPPPVSRGRAGFCPTERRGVLGSLAGQGELDTKKPVERPTPEKGSIRGSTQSAAGRGGTWQLPQDTWSLTAGLPRPSTSSLGLRSTEAPGGSKAQKPSIPSQSPCWAPAFPPPPRPPAQREQNRPLPPLG